MLHGKLLADSQTAGDVLDPVGHAAYLVLPSPTGGHDLLHGKDMGIQNRFCVFNSQELKDRFHAGRGENRRGSKAAALRYIRHLRMHLKAAAKADQDLVQVPSLLRNHTSSQQARFLKSKGIVRIARGL